MGADVKPGQIWADNDWRSEGRTLLVERIEDGKAVCVTLTNIATEQDRLDHGGLGARDRRGCATRISLARFVPISTGYRYVEG